MDTIKAIDSAIQDVIDDFHKAPGKYFTEEDVRWRLTQKIEAALLPAADIKVSDGMTSLVHTEFPTPFKCLMGERSFKVTDEGKRGHFDIVILNSEIAKRCELDLLRSQDYSEFNLAIRNNKMRPFFLDCAIELKLFRTAKGSKWTKSAGETDAQYALQTVSKLDATLKNTGDAKQFAKRGIVLLFDNRIWAKDEDSKPGRDQFLKRMKSTDWKSHPSLSCIWVTIKNTLKSPSFN